MTPMSITAREYLENLEGFALVGCAVRARDIFYFVARQQGTGANPAVSEHLAKKRVVAFMRDDPEGRRWSNAELLGMDRLFASSSAEPRSQFVGVDAEGAVYVLGSGQSRLEQPIPTGPDGPLRGGVRRARRIAGRVYVVSGRRGLCRRVDTDQWQSLCPPAGPPPDSMAEDYRLTRDWGFSDVDGFSPTDLYAVGGAGDLWHVGDGTHRKIGLKTNMFLESVCCAGDGVVYVGAQSGTILAGRGDRWSVLHRGELSVPFRDLVWHDGALYGGNDYGLWQLRDGRMDPVDLPDEIRICAGHLSVGEGVMLMAGVFGAAFLEAGRWTALFNTYHPPT